MAELNLKQINARLNEEFRGEKRKLVFWYDDKAEFAEDIKDIELDNAKVYFLQHDNQFYTKYFLERKDKENNYLIYAPFPKPDVRENHLEDTLLYSKRFFADRASLLMADLGVDEKYKNIIEKHIKFFANKDRTQRFYDLEIEQFNEENIIVGMLGSICRTQTCSFEEVVRAVLSDGECEENKFIDAFKKYDLLVEFWKLCERHFGYIDNIPSLTNFVLTLFVTYTAKSITGELPESLKSIVSHKSGNIITFMDNIKNSVLYKDRYNELSEFVSNRLNIVKVFENLLPEELLYCDTFVCIDKIIIRWIKERLLAEDTGAMLDNHSIKEVASIRSKMHFSESMGKIYHMLGSAYDIVVSAKYTCPDSFSDILEKYKTSDYKIDQNYRHFYYDYDSLDDSEDFERLRELVENIYTNEYLDKLLQKWNSGILEEDAFGKLPLQIDFYDSNIGGLKDRTVVIISDALRYEVGNELYTVLADDPKSNIRIDTSFSVLPSYTRLGMAALLPHKSITMSDDYTVLVDGMSCDNLLTRQNILQRYCDNSICVQFDDIKNMKKSELRDIFTGKQLVYVYHNQIDARGDKANTEDEVFVACKEAVNEIADLIRRISSNANTHHFIVTADHGFIYKRDKLNESDKINVRDKNAFVNRRFIVSTEAIYEDGIENISMGSILRNDDNKVVSFPISSNVFKVSGGGQNFVHGGSSPQEMLIPVLNIKMERGHIDTGNAQIALVSMVQKITSNVTVLEFIQSEAVSDTVKATTYKLYFISDDNEKISNEATLFADSRELDARKRIFRMNFRFKDKKYDKNRNYYLAAYDEGSGEEIWRHHVVMDLVGESF